MTASRLLVLRLAALGLGAALLTQIVALHLFGASSLGISLSSGERLRVLDVVPARGRILDREGRPLAVNVPRFVAQVVPGDLPEDPNARRAALTRLEARVGIPYAGLERAVQAGLESVDPLAPITIRDDLTRDEATALRAAMSGIEGVVIEAQAQREYGGGDLLAHVLGYVGPIAAGEAETYLEAGYRLDARVGLGGVELTYEDALRGVPGEDLVVADAAGHPLRALEERPPEVGADVVLSIDLDFQRAVRDALLDGIAAGVRDQEPAQWPNPDSPREAGAAVVMDVRTGEVLALVSVPSFEANLLGTEPDDEALAALIADGNRPLVDRTYMEVRAPGSIFKPLVAAAALEEGVASAGTQITSRGLISIRDQYQPDVYYVFRDWAAHGTLDLYGGIARSSDVYFYYLAGGYAQNGEQLFDGLGINRLARYARAAGLGRATGLDLPGEASGLVPDAEWKDETVGEPWVLGDTYTLGIGQGYLAVTPIQMAVVGAAIANGGTVLVPHVVAALQRGDAVTPLGREVAGTLPVDPANLAIVREAMRRAAEAGGTARTGKPAGITIGGKTGTAEFGRPAADASFDTHAWYVGFAPFDQPEIVVVVQLEHGVGSTHAGPVARRILEAYFNRGAQVTR
ncbi:MAG: penicillin-binding protein 2 [Dehalococcoidia bacterium]